MNFDEILTNFYEEFVKNSSTSSNVFYSLKFQEYFEGWATSRNCGVLPPPSLGKVCHFAPRKKTQDLQNSVFALSQVKMDPMVLQMDQTRLKIRFKRARSTVFCRNWGYTSLPSLQKIFLAKTFGGLGILENFWRIFGNDPAKRI